jgi:hypothetical protein
MKAKELNSRRLIYHKRRHSSKRFKHHEWKRSQKVKLTMNNKEYKIWRKHVEDPKSCWYCAPHQGCNYHRYDRPYKSWKFKSHKRKQWMYKREKCGIYKTKP